LTHLAQKFLPPFSTLETLVEVLQVFFLVAVDAHVEMLILSLVGSHPIDSFDKKYCQCLFWWLAPLMTSQSTSFCGFGPVEAMAVVF
jgi:hypothetical protein